VAEGRTIAELAAELRMSPKTARNHLSNALGKLEIRSRVEATLYALRAGLLDEPQRVGRWRDDGAAAAGNQVVETMD
jgi:predicted transcriptional regulator